MPLCSILLPTHSSPLAFFRAALQSARLQTVPVEVCVCNDGGVEERGRIVEEMMREEGGWPIKYTWQPNGGVASALNACLEMAAADWIAWLPADDLYTADHVEVMLKAIDADLCEISGRNPDLPIAYCSYEEGVPIPQARWPAAQFPSREALFAALQQGCFINAATMVWHRSVLEAVGGWNVRIVHAQDYANILACAELHNFLAVHHYGVRRRLHPGQMVRTLNRPEERALKAVDMAWLKDRYGAAGGVWVPEEPKPGLPS